ncbi:hypothetical protein RND71_020928 [Anisodus tanguticus]|uniref:Protein kinase domain-containing protein n=1 Tax=Anisodus tanguticus TaxID=243964 RepID=A0AAE1RWU0_9SOLA|nr:hypothetical protein RND71_020928 [Anisodus tanguticus]
MMHSVDEITDMGCCGCFGFSFARKLEKIGRPNRGYGTNGWSREPLLQQQEVEEGEDDDDGFDSGDIIDTGTEDEEVCHSPVKRSEEILVDRAQNGLICREIPVKETHSCAQRWEQDGVNEYAREYKIGAGSYGKVVLYRSCTDGKHYAIKAFHKSHLLKLRVAPSETAMGDVLREVSIMKMLCHPNIVNLIEFSSTWNENGFVRVLAPHVFLEKIKHRSHFGHNLYASAEETPLLNIIHGDIKPDNLLVTASGWVKIGDFSVSQAFEDDNDELRRSPGTPVFTAPECCLGERYHGKAAETWAVGVTLYCIILGKYPFLGDTLQDTYDKVSNTKVDTLEAVSQHEWVIGDEDPIPQYSCWCQREKL